MYVDGASAVDHVLSAQYYTHLIMLMESRLAFDMSSITTIFDSQHS